MVTAFNYAGMAASFVSVPLLLHWLGADGYGMMLAALALGGYFAFADVGMNWASAVLIGQAHGRSDRPAIARIVRHSAVLAAGSIAVILLVAGGFALAAKLGTALPVFGTDPRAGLLLFVAGLQFASNLGWGVFYNVFFGLQEGYWAAVYQGLGRLLAAGLSLAGAWLTRDPSGALLGNVVGITVCSAAAAVHARRRHPWAFAAGSICDREQYRLQFRTGAKNFGLQIARTLQGTAPVVLIGSLVGPAAVPLWTAPATLIGAVFSVFFSWNANLQPAYGEAWAKGDRPWVADTFRRTFRLMLVVQAVAFAGFVWVAPAVVKLWTNGVLEPSVLQCGAVAAFAVTQSLATAVQFCLAGINQHRRIAGIELLHALVLWSSAAVALLWFGLEGLATAIIISYLFTSCLVGTRELSHRLGVQRVVPQVRWIIPWLASGAIGLAVGGMLSLCGSSPLAVDPGLTSVAAGVLAASSVVVSLVLSRAFGWSDWLALVRRVTGRGEVNPMRTGAIE